MADNEVRTRTGIMNNSNRRVAVIGAGSFGTTFGKILADAGNSVTIWARRHEIANEIQVAKRNSKYLPGVNLPKSLHATAELQEAVRGAQQIYLAVPSRSVRETLKNLEPFLTTKTILVSLIKGVEQKTNLRISEIIADTINIAPEKVAVLSGPNIALEIAQEQPTAAVASSVCEETAKEVAIAATTKYFRTYVNTDVVGTELGGVLKNLIALAIGIVDGVGYGENTKAAIITRGLTEMTDFAVGLGANPATMTGLAGLGDLITTCQSPLSRNNTAGRLIGQGYSLEETKAHMSQTAEGITSLAPVLAIAEQRGIKMPIVSQVEMVLNQKMSPKNLGPHLATEDSVPLPEVSLTGQEKPGFFGFFKKLRRNGS